MKVKPNIWFTLTYEAEIEAEDIGEAKRLGELDQVKMKSRLKKIESMDETWQRFYDDEYDE